MLLNTDVLPYSSPVSLLVGMLCDACFVCVVDPSPSQSSVLEFSEGIPGLLWNYMSAMRRNCFEMSDYLEPDAVLGVYNVEPATSEIFSREAMLEDSGPLIQAHSCLFSVSVITDKILDVHWVQDFTCVSWREFTTDFGYSIDAYFSNKLVAHFEEISDAIIRSINSVTSSRMLIPIPQD